jgi:hypothetical protein
VYRLFHEEGPGAAGAHFLAGIGGALKPMPHPAELPPRGAEMMARLSANGPPTMEHELRQFTSYVPDGTALAAVSDRLVLAAGRETRGHLPYRPAALLAERLGGTVTEFPGGHSGFTELPEEFTRLLEETLSRRWRRKHNCGPCRAELSVRYGPQLCAAPGRARVSRCSCAGPG